MRIFLVFLVASARAYESVDCKSDGLNGDLGRVTRMKLLPERKLLRVVGGECVDGSFEAFDLNGVVECPKPQDETWKRVEAKLTMHCMDAEVLKQTSNARLGVVFSRKHVLADMPPVDIRGNRITVGPSDGDYGIVSEADGYNFFLCLGRGKIYRFIDENGLQVHANNFIVFESVKGFFVRQHRLGDRSIYLYHEEARSMHTMNTNKGSFAVYRYSDDLVVVVLKSRRRTG